MGQRQAKSPRDQSKTAATVKVGNYSAPVDTAGLGDMKSTFIPESPSLVKKTPTVNDKPTQAGLGDVGGAIRRIVTGIGRHLNSTGNQRSPSTTLDRKPKPAAADTLSDAERERIARKYVD